MTERTSKSSTKSLKDDSYIDAAKAFTDDAMRIDNLAPNITNAVEKDVPLRNSIKEVVIETIQKEPAAHDAINEAVSTKKAIKQSNADWKKPVFLIPTVISIVGAICAITSIIVTVVIATKK